jgi:hypothetical protein
VAPETEFVHLAFQLESDVRTYPLDAPRVILTPVNAPVQATSRRYHGLFFQIPTAPVDDTLILLLPKPSAMMILLVRDDVSPVTLAPMMVLPDPVVIPCHDSRQRIVLLEPEVILFRELTPIAVLNCPVLFVSIE